MSTPTGLNSLERIWFTESVHARVAALPERTRANLAKLILQGRRRPALGFDLLEGRLNLSTVVSLAETPVEIDPSVLVSVPADPRDLPVEAGPGENEIVEWTPPGDPANPRDIPVQAGPGANEVVDQTLGGSGQSARSISDADPQGVFLTGVPSATPSSSIPTSGGDAGGLDVSADPSGGGEISSDVGKPTSNERTRPDDGTAPPATPSIELKSASSAPSKDALEEEVSNNESTETEPQKSASTPAPEDSSAAGPIPDFDPDELIPMLFDLAEMPRARGRGEAIDEFVARWVAEGSDASIPVLIHASEAGMGSTIILDDIPISDEDGSLGYLAAFGAGALGAVTWASRQSRPNSSDASEEKPQDARRHERTVLNENVELLARLGGEPASDRTIAVSRDVSNTGIGILHTTPLEGERVQISYPDQGKLITRWGIVRWTSRLAATVYMSGIEFEPESSA